jgi:glucose/arabinose dehydrogenase
VSAHLPYPRRILPAGLIVLALVTGCGSADPPEPAPSTGPPVPSGAPESTPAAGPPEVSADATVIATELAVPWAVAFLPDGGALVTERDTRRIVKVGPESDGDLLRTRVVQTLDEVFPRGEGGLLGIAVSPDYDTDETVFIYYSAGEVNQIARMRLGEAPEPIVTDIPAGGNHNGGRLAFGPDGYLYATTGEVGNPPLAQERDNLGGKILRMTPDGEPAPGNPFPDSLIWSYGHRNVQGLAWDSEGRLWASEFGANRWDELNLIEPGENYGWPEIEGMGEDDRFVNPVVVWPTDESSCSGAAAVAELVIVACLRGQRLWLVDVTGGEVRDEPRALLTGEYGRLRAVAVAPDGSLWVTTSNRDGRGNAAPDDDRILRLEVSGGDPAARS